MSNSRLPERTAPRLPPLAVPKPSALTTAIVAAVLIPIMAGATLIGAARGVRAWLREEWAAAKARQEEKRPDA